MKKALLGLLIGTVVAVLLLGIFGIVTYPDNNFEGAQGYHAIMMSTVSVIALPIAVMLGAVIGFIKHRKLLMEKH